MALSMILGMAGMTPEKIETEATITLEQKDGGFAVTPASHLEVVATIPGASDAAFQECAAKAKARLSNFEVAERDDHDERAAGVISGARPGQRSGFSRINLLAAAVSNPLKSGNKPGGVQIPRPPAFFLVMFRFLWSESPWQSECSGRETAGEVQELPWGGCAGVCRAICTTRR